MRNFQDTFEKRKRSCVSAFSICMTVPLMFYNFIREVKRAFEPNWKLLSDKYLWFRKRNDVFRIFKSFEYFWISKLLSLFVNVPRSNEIVFFFFLLEGSSYNLNNHIIASNWKEIEKWFSWNKVVRR